MVPRCHGGSDAIDNLALACRRCNLHKGPNLSGVDPDTGSTIRLFNPRIDDWTENFLSQEDGTIQGLTAIGRATARVLAMNTDRRIKLRRAIRLLEETE